ncbi:MAG: acyl-CoA dehydrogenase family protein [Phenylobacterium sp.]|uniref:acyl-CoA dehydrogenase family protein n=1 Tax=Phenylobacterium sp. TaxID=1871053 RepID=UPI00273479B2|nr:acyl-CoA dehydrogenase family protein [Phenylobacterium sp.]MDP3173591.1 acyl-CoA dehydrogenase family protein [Phenylobacterium sp.]
MTSGKWDEDESVVMFAESVGKFLDREASPETYAKWREDGVVDRAFWTKAAEAGLLGLSIDPEYGGHGGDFRHEATLIRQLFLRGLNAFGAPLHNAIVAPYIQMYGTEDQKRRWLPKMVTGELISAIAMSEPGAGSDLQGVRTRAVRDGDSYVINGQKTFITNGQTANLIAVICKTDPEAGSRGVSIVFVETDGCPGFQRGRNLDKLGLEAADTSELFFEDVRVPVENLLGGTEGQGFYQLMQKLPQERLMIAVQALGAIDRAMALTIDYVKERNAFGKKLIDFQNTQFKLAECKTEAAVAKAFVDDCIETHLREGLDATRASMAKLWLSECEARVVDECLQLFGGYGYMAEYPIAQMYRDARVQRIYGGTSEIMKVLISRSL